MHRIHVRPRGVPIGLEHQEEGLARDRHRHDSVGLPVRRHVPVFPHAHRRPALLVILLELEPLALGGVLH